MPQIISFVGANFSLRSLIQGSDDLTLILEYGLAPDAVNPTVITDALHPANYTLAGPTTPTVTSVNKLTSTQFSLHLSSPGVVSGLYTLTVLNVQSAGQSLIGGNTITVHCVSSASKEPLTEGAENDDAAGIIRRWLPSQYRFKTVWEALIHGVAAGDNTIMEQVFKAYDQLFMSTASGEYLVKKAADFGITYPSDAAPSDEVFRQLAVALSTNKLVHQALLDIIEVFYGENSTRANLISTLAQPYNFTNGDTLNLSVDGKSITVTFLTTQFTNITQATAAEVVAVLNKAFRDANLHAYAEIKVIDGVNYIAIFSGALGLNGRVGVVGGTANRSLRFDTFITVFENYANPPITWQGQYTTYGQFKLVWQNGLGTALPTALMGVEVGDYVLLNFTNVPNLRGSYEILDVHYDVVAGSAANQTWITIKPIAGFVYHVGDTVAITQTANNEIAFFRPTIKSIINNINPAFIVQANPDGVTAILPATTQAVDRIVGEAAFLHVSASIAISYAIRTVGPNQIEIHCINPHNLTQGDFVYFQDVAPDRSMNGAGAFIYSQSGRWDEEGKVLSITSPTVFVMSALYAQAGRATGGNVVPFKAPSGDTVLGPYILDPISGLAITAGESTISVPLAQGQGISILPVTSTSQFPNQVGYIAIGFGTKYESGPIKYLGVLDATNLLIDRSYSFALDIPSGTSITLLAQKAPFSPTDKGYGLFYLTDSNAGRIAAEDFLDQAAAAGINVTKQIVYPGDRGLGGQGNPTTGQKLSDKVEVWAGNDVDAELVNAHGQ